MINCKNANEILTKTAARVMKNAKAKETLKVNRLGKYFFASHRPQL